ncbi:MAG: hypothetical protein AAFU77_16200 [Myxococcota bacterium]
MIDEDGTKLIEATTSEGRALEVMFDEVAEGNKLSLRKSHIDGATPGAVGIRELKGMIREYGRERGFGQVILEGARRSTGRMKGRVPRPCVIDVD